MSNCRRFLRNENCIRQHLFQYFCGEDLYGFSKKIDRTFIDRLTLTVLIDGSINGGTSCRKCCQRTLMLKDDLSLFL